ncbi:hypothetical protein ACLKA7_012100 [Drosophila subpalustris]
MEKELRDVNTFTALERKDLRKLIANMMANEPGVLVFMLDSQEFVDTFFTFLRFLVGDTRTRRKEQVVNRMLLVILAYAKDLKRLNRQQRLEQELPFFMKNFLLMLEVPSTNRVQIMLLKTISMGTLIVREQMGPYLVSTYRSLCQYLNLDCWEEDKHLCNAAFKTLYAVAQVSNENHIILIADQIIAICEKVLLKEHLPNMLQKKMFWNLPMMRTMRTW